MKNKIFSLSLIIFLGLFTFLNSCFAVGTETTDTGLKLTYINRNGIKGVAVQRWDSYELGTSGTYIYNDSGSTTTNAGSILVSGYEFKIAIARTTNTDAGVYTFRPEYRIGTTSFWYNGTSTSMTGTNTIIMTISEPVTEIRWGMIKTGTTTGQVTFFEEYTRYLRQ